MKATEDILKITKTAKLEFDSATKARFMELLRRFNTACNWLSAVAYEERLFQWHPLQTRGYRELRLRFGLTSHQATVAVRKVAHAYRVASRRGKQAKFKPTGALPVIHHSYKRDGTVRFYGFRVPFRSEPGLLLSSACEARIVIRGKCILLRQVLKVASPDRRAPANGYLGVDLGLVNIAVDSDGEVHPGNPHSGQGHPFRAGQLRGKRKRHRKLRRKLQKKSTRSAKRRARLLSGKERRFASHVNHAIAKDLVAKACSSGRGIALEDLRYIRARIKAGKAQRGDLHSWAFERLRSFIEYKARLKGVTVVLVDPRNTSRMCPAPTCGYVDRRNRMTQDWFRCVRCGCAGPADAIAAENIRRAAGSRPDAAAS